MTVGQPGGSGSGGGTNGGAAEQEKKLQPLLPIVFGLLFLGAAVLAFFIAPDSNEGFVTGAAALTFITAAAVGIERAIEAFWAFIGMRSGFGGWWPLREVRDSIQEYERKADELLTGPLASAVDLLEEAAERARGAGKVITDVELELAAFKDKSARLTEKVNLARTNLAPGSPRFEVVAEAVQDGISTARRAAERAAELTGIVSGEIIRAAEDGAASCDRIAAFITSFNDNPARKLASLSIGATLGLLIAGCMGLNLFVAVLAPPANANADAGAVAGFLSYEWGILLTGIIIGFGANPTHEVIKALERRKNASGGVIEPVVQAEPEIAGLAIDSDTPRGAIRFERTMATFGAPDTIEVGTPVRLAPLQIPVTRRVRHVRRTD